MAEAKELKDSPAGLESLGVFRPLPERGGRSARLARQFMDGLLAGM